MRLNYVDKRLKTMYEMNPTYWDKTYQQNFYAEREKLAEEKMLLQNDYLNMTATTGNDKISCKAI